MTERHDPPALQVHNQKDSVMLATATDTGKMFAVLEDNVLNKLHTQSRKARDEALKADGGPSAIGELCATLDGILKNYRFIRDEYYHRIEIEAERDDAEQRLQDAISGIQNSASS